MVPIMQLANIERAPDYPDTMLHTEVLVWPQNGYTLNCKFYTTNKEHKPATNSMSARKGDKLTNCINLKIDARNDIEAASKAVRSLREISGSYLRELMLAKRALRDADAWHDDGKLKRMLDATVVSHQPWFLTRNASLCTIVNDEYEIQARFTIETEYDGNSLAFVSRSGIKHFDLFELINGLIALVKNLATDAIVSEPADECVPDPEEREYLELLESCLVT